MVTSLRFPRCFASAAACRGRVYVIGGAWLDALSECKNFNSVFDVDVYNEQQKMWEGVTSLKVGRHDAGCAVIGEDI